MILLEHTHTHTLQYKRLKSVQVGLATNSSMATSITYACIK
jgi:hypothetical protein